jgi:PKD repeat protein
MKTHTFLRMAARAVLAGLVMLTVSCELGRQGAPPLSGPSEFGLSVTLAANPDRLPRDGSSRSIVMVTARDHQGQPKANQRITLSLGDGSALAALSATEVQTGNDGRASFDVVAPQPTATGNSIVIMATPFLDNADNAAPRMVAIAITGASNRTAPSPSFVVTPASPEVNQVATFDASATMDEGVQCLNLCFYAWDFDDGTTASGRQVTHAFTVGRPHNVALTVTDPTGLSETLRRLVIATVPSAPTVVLTVAPNPPVINQMATFIATATAAPGHSIQEYEWNFGDGETALTTTNTVAKTYTARGIYAVTVRATDDLGKTGAAGITLNLTTGSSTGISASFTFSPTDPDAGTAVNFNASASTANNGATIVTYAWDFGDGTAGTGVAPSHTFTAAGTYVVSLTVTDNQGRTAVTTQSVTVSTP